MIYRNSRTGAALNEIRNFVLKNRAGVSAGGLTDRKTGGVAQRQAWRPRATTYFHPWEIYRYPVNTDENTIDGWRKFRVRSGRIGQVAPEDVAGSDKAADSYSPQQGADITEFVVPVSTTDYALWISYDVGPAATPTTPPTAEILGSADPDANGWPGFPLACTTEGTICRLIGYITTGSDEEMTAAVEQILTTHEDDWVQACISVDGTDKVINVRCDAPPFAFV